MVLFKKIAYTLLVLSIAVFFFYMFYGDPEKDFAATGTVSDRNTGISGTFGLFGGQMNTYYKLKVQYLNPNNNKYQYVDVYVSADEYDRYRVGDSYEVFIHKAGNTFPVDTRHISGAGMGLADTAPIFGGSFLTAALILILSSIWIKR